MENTAAAEEEAREETGRERKQGGAATYTGASRKYSACQVQNGDSRSNEMMVVKEDRMMVVKGEGRERGGRQEKIYVHSYLEKRGEEREEIKKRMKKKEEKTGDTRKRKKGKKTCN